MLGVKSRTYLSINALGLFQPISIALAVLFLRMTPVFAEPAPEFSLPILDQEKYVSLSDMKGQVVYLDFWASWCGPCAVSLPELEKIRSKFHSAGFEVIAINLDQSLDDARRFLRDKKITYPILIDRSQLTPKRYGVEGMPTAFLIDRGGQVRETHIGFKESDVEELTKLIQRLLGELES